MMHLQAPRFAPIFAPIIVHYVAIAMIAVTAVSTQAQPPLPPFATGAPSTEEAVVNEATAVLQELVTGTSTQIPAHLLASAEGVAIVPRFVRGAFVLGIGGGRGVLLTKDASGNWQAPEFLTIGGGSIGWQAGVQATDLVLVFRSPRSLNNMRQGKLTLGVNASAAAGPIGRDAGAATDLSAQAEILTYSKTRGLFAGVSLSGASLQIDVPATQRFYQTIGGGPGVVPPSAINLVNELTRFSSLARNAATVGPVSATAPLRTTPGAGATTTTPNAAPMGPVATVGAATPMLRVAPGSLAKLEAAVAGLLVSVDAQWQAFLALPVTWQTATEIPADQVQTVLMRYERIATDPQFESLRALPSFGVAIKELRDLAAQAPVQERLQLPPPPNVDQSDFSRGRY